MSLLWKLILVEYVVAGVLLATARGARRERSRPAPTKQSGWLAPSPLVAFVAALLLSMGCTWLRSPTPKVHDEFSYLLAGDTFAEGRLTNPTHSHWRHFESIHILSLPTYSSKYPPAQGLFLALGQALTGQPIVGVWLSTAAASASLLWMCQAWFPRRWTPFALLLIVLNPTLQLLWGVTFMGGAVATLGSALLFGAWGRLQRSGGPMCYAIAAIGLAILANSRPFEGLLVASPILFAAVRSVAQGRIRLRAVEAFTFAAVGGCLLIVMVVHNYAVTGDARQLPYERHSRDYMAGPIFLWQTPPTRPEYANPQLEQFHTRWELDNYRALQGDWLNLIQLKAYALASAYHSATRPTLFLLALFGAGLPPNRFTTPLLAIVLMAIGHCTTVWIYPQYLGPAIPPLLLLSVNGARRIDALRGLHGGWGRAALSRLSGAFCLFLLIPALSFVLDRDLGWHRQRERILAELKRLPGDDLVIVRYRDDRKSHEEWVYNRADIDAADVVWARDFGVQGNQDLISYFSQRKVWLLEADGSPPRLLEYAADTTARSPKVAERSEGEVTQ